MVGEGVDVREGPGGGQAATSAGHELEGRLFGGRFRAERVLKDGQGIVTLLGVDLEGGAQVIIKVAGRSGLSRVAHMRLEHEASVLREVRPSPYPSLPYVGHEDHLLYLVAPYVPGVTLEQRLADGPLSVAETLSVGRCVLQALQDAHDHGVLHLDVKPANVVVSDNGRGVKEATLIDFGLARSRWLDAAVRGVPVGTVRYMSPEQTGMLDREVDERSDLYSAGVLLFECLSGRPPFEGGTVGEVLRRHLTDRPAELRRLGLEVPRALDEVIQRLLHKDPGDRYQSAAGVVADLTAIDDQLQAGMEEPGIVIGLHDRRRTLTDPAFVGRDAQLDSLDEELEHARRGKGGLLVVESESGRGKTRLIEELAQRASQRGVWVLRGQGLDQAAQRPYQLMTGIAGGLLAAVQSESDLRARLRTDLGDHADAVVGALPELREVIGSGTGLTMGPEAYGQTRALAALSAMLDALGTPEVPALVLLDDCQWADDAMVKLLQHWSRSDPGDRFVLVVIAFRSEEVDDEHPLRDLSPAVHLKLPPLGSDDVRRLAESMAGPLPEEALATVERLSEGSPFMATAVLRGLVEAGALVVEPSGWRVEPLAWAEVQSSRRAAAFLSRRLELLPAKTVHLLSVGAALGKEFDPEFAAHLAKTSAYEAMSRLEEARRRHIIWLSADDVRCTFAHDKLREALLDRLSDAERRSLHRQAAEEIEAIDTNRVFELAYHFHAAGDLERAFPYALQAAELARARHTLRLAEQHYAIAKQGADSADEETRRRICEGLGDVHMLSGNYEAAAQEFEQARSLAERGLEQARVQSKLGELAYKRGDVDTAIGRLEEALRLLGEKVPRRSVTLLLWFMWEVTVQVFHSLLPSFLGRRQLEGGRTHRVGVRSWSRSGSLRSKDRDKIARGKAAGPEGGKRRDRGRDKITGRTGRAKTEADLLAVRIHGRLFYAYFVGRSALHMLWTHLREMNLAERYPPTPELAQAYSTHAPTMGVLAMYDRGIRYAERSLEIRKAQGDLWGQGQSLHFLGVVLYDASRFEESIVKCTEAIRLLERTGDRWEENVARWHLAMSRYRLGDLQGALQTARQVREVGVEIGDAMTTGISLKPWGLATSGNIPEEFAQAELERPGKDVQTAAMVFQAEAVRLLGQRHPLEAVRVLDDGLHLLRRARLINVYVFPLFTWMATALRQAAETTPTLATGRRRDLLRRGRRISSWAVRIARLYRNDLPHALRERAFYAAFAGRTARARRYLDESVTVADEQGARYERAQSLLARGEVGRLHGWSDAEADLKAAQQELDLLRPEVSHGLESRRPVTVSLADRFDTLLEVGRGIAAALSEHAVVAAGKDATVRLLRGEGCLFLRVVEEESSEDDGTGMTDVRTLSGKPVEQQVKDLALQALEAGRPVVYSEGMSQDPDQSLALLGVRSAMCAPIFVRQRPAGCFFVRHGQVDRLFGPEEERLAQFIATLAGAAMENIEGFSAVQQLSESLEQRVEERTAELARSNLRLDRSLHELEEAYELQRQMAEQLRELDRLKNEFVAMVAHDLRTPMAIVTGLIEMLSSNWEEISEDDKQQYLAVVSSHTSQLSRLIEDVLQVAHIESGQFSYDVAPFDLAELVRNVVDEFAVSTGPERFRSHIPQGLPPARGDENRNRQVLRNLLSNAVKFSPPRSEIELRVSLQGQDLQVEVRDRGIGIRSEDMPKLFEKFQRLEQRQQGQRAQGTGLGLYICRCLVEAQDGKIWAESVEGQGSTFTYTLPTVGSLQRASEG
ncbi:MAG: ATP-binding protein [Nitriliruptorales bacterium]